MFDGPTDQQLWADDYTKPVNSVLKLHAEVALAIADEIRANLSKDERDRIADAQDIDREAYDLYLRGLANYAIFSKEGFIESIDYFERAVAIEPRFALAWSALGRTHWEIYANGLDQPDLHRQPARDASLKALSLDDSIAISHVTVAELDILENWSWDDADRRIKKAILLDPNSGHVRWVAGFYEQNRGTWSNAVAECAKALELDPLNEFTRAQTSSVLNISGESAKAVTTLETLIDESPDSFIAQNQLIYAYSSAGRFEEAVELAQRYTEQRGRDAYSQIHLSYALAASGEDSAARQIIDELESAGQLESESSDIVALAYIFLGEPDTAFDYLDRSFQSPSPLTMVLMRGYCFTDSALEDPNFVAFRTDPRYFAMLDRMKYSPVPPGHPGYEEQQTYLTNQAAEKLLAERGTDDAPKISSLAVLPLDNLSPQGEEDYFAESMTEAITAELAKIKALKVRGRTSAMQYKDTDLEIPEIAKALKVDALIEGSVTRVDDEVRITVQLVHGATDEHLWSESYTETITSVLKLQADVAIAIAEAVDTEITGEERARIATTREVDPKAHEFFVMGEHFRRTKTPDALRSSIRLFEQAVAIDPKFAEGWATLGSNYSEFSGWGFDDPVEWIPKARSAYERAFELDPYNGEAYVGLMEITMTFDHDWKAARSYGERAVELAPNSGRVHFLYAWFLISVGEMEKAYSHALKALEIDEEDPEVVREVAFLFVDTGRVEDARSLLENYLSEHPEYELGYDVLANIYLTQGMEEKSLAAALRFLGPIEEKPEETAFYASYLAYFGKEEAARSIMNAGLENESDLSLWNLDIAYAFIELGEIDRSIEWFEKGIAAKEWMVVRFKQLPYQPSTINNAEWVALRTDDRFWELCDQVGFPPLPSDHPGYADEMRWMAKKAAREMLREKGIVGEEADEIIDE